MGPAAPLINELSALETSWFCMHSRVSSTEEGPKCTAAAYPQSTQNANTFPETRPLLKGRCARNSWLYQQLGQLGMRCCMEGATDLRTGPGGLEGEAGRVKAFPFCRPVQGLEHSCHQARLAMRGLLLGSLELLHNQDFPQRFPNR